ncbi:hypothetical protein ABW636_02210 [Aquimarina sp. 2201CG1-2-11]|uniref:hypothetical protein n=1 Tax=Aquimarina discodermiae TaxID=3231043 RepID=UPI003461A314
MKKTNLIFLSLMLTFFIACNKDDDNSSTQNDLSSNPEEEVELNASTVSNGISIDGATREEGTPPQPTGTLPFSLEEDTQSAFLNNGFDISFNAPDNYAGSYIQIVSNDGIPASEYFDVPKTSFKPSNKKPSNHFFAKNLNDNEIEIDVDFGDAIPPGKFCYLICIYDDQSNISEPIEVCVEVEAWGGSSDLVATWEMHKQEEVYDGMTDIKEIDVESCEEYFFFCTATESDTTIENGACKTLKTADLIFNADGTYTFNSTEDGTTVDYEATNNNNCDPIFKDDGETYYSGGNWAYDEEEKRLTLVEFESKEDDFPITIDQDGDLLFDGDITIDGNTFSVFEEDTFQGQTETFKAYFRKK